MIILHLCPFCGTPLGPEEICDCRRNKQEAVKVKVDPSSPEPRPINEIAADLKKELYKRLKAEEEAYFLTAELLQAVIERVRHDTEEDA